VSIEEVLSSVGLVHFAATDQEKSLAARVVTAEQRVAAVEREHQALRRRIMDTVPKGPRCRDCADCNGTCQNDGKTPCDPVELAFSRFAALEARSDQQAAVERTIAALRELDQPVFVAASKAAFEASTGKDASTANMDEVDQYVEVAAAVITAALAAAAPAATQQTNGDQSNG